MAFREVSVVQVKELLRRWLRGEGERPIADDQLIPQGLDQLIPHRSECDSRPAAPACQGLRAVA
jgi:hypothetical protein